MAQRSKHPAEVASAGGAKGIAAFSENTSIAQTIAAAASSAITIRRGPGGYAEWLVSIEGVCTDVPMSDQKLRNYSRFCNVIEHWSGVSLDPQSAWLAIVEVLIAKDGAS
jgi:hypothetical protein